MKNKGMIFKCIAATIMALCAFAPAINVAAENTYTPVTGGTVQFEKYLVYDAKAMPPQVTFEFTLTDSGQGIAADSANNKIAVYSGNDAGITVIDSSKDAVTVGSASFTNATPKNDTVQALDSTASLGNHATQTNDPVDLSGGKAYSRVPVTIDFTNIQFNEPGVYRWKVTENANATAAGMGITNDSADHFIDVYVNATGFSRNTGTNGGTGTGTLAIVGYVFHKNAAFQPTSLTTAQEPADGKAVGFTNTYETFDFTISNEVAGNQAAHDKYFLYTVTIENAGLGTKILAEGTFDRTTANSATNSRTQSDYKNQIQPELIVTDGTTADLTQVYYLEHDQNITLTGIPKNAKVTVTETPEDYSPSVTATGTGATVSANNQTVTVNTITSDVTAAYTNTKTGTIPTGIVTTVLPGLLIAFLGGAGILGLRKRKD